MIWHRLRRHRLAMLTRYGRALGIVCDCGRTWWPR